MAMHVVLVDTNIAGLCIWSRIGHSTLVLLRIGCRMSIWCWGCHLGVETWSRTYRNVWMKYIIDRQSPMLSMYYYFNIINAGSRNQPTESTTDLPAVPITQNCPGTHPRVGGVPEVQEGTNAVICTHITDLCQNEEEVVSSDYCAEIAKHHWKLN